MLSCPNVDAVLSERVPCGFGFTHEFSEINEDGVEGRG